MPSLQPVPGRCDRQTLIDYHWSAAAGVLLRRLLGDAALEGTTHVIIDEVHERSVDSDLALLLLRDLLASGRAPGLKVVLMSATADAEAFAAYFDASLGGPVRSRLPAPSHSSTHFLSPLTICVPPPPASCPPPQPGCYPGSWSTAPMVPTSKAVKA